MSLLKIGGDTYIIDFMAMEKLISGNPLSESTMEEDSEITQNLDEAGDIISTTIFTKKYNKGKEIDVSKYETLRMLLEIVLMGNEEIDDELGAKRGMNKLPIPFKVAFNTLKYYEVLKNLDL